MKRLYVIMLVILVNITALAQQIEPVQFNTLEYWWDGNVCLLYTSDAADDS